MSDGKHSAFERHKAGLKREMEAQRPTPEAPGEFLTGAELEGAQRAYDQMEMAVVAKLADLEQRAIERGVIAPLELDIT